MQFTGEMGTWAGLVPRVEDFFEKKYFIMVCYLRNSLSVEHMIRLKKTSRAYLKKKGIRKMNDDRILNIKTSDKINTVCERNKIAIIFKENQNTKVQTRLNLLKNMRKKNHEDLITLENKYKTLDETSIHSVDSLNLELDALLKKCSREKKEIEHLEK